MKKIILSLCFALSLTSPIAAFANESQVIEIKITEEGFEPSNLEVPANVPVTLKVTRTTDNTCATDIKIKDKKIEKKLPLNETVSIDLGKVKKGKLGFACGMNMLKGEITAK
jgi:plastocyanin domain-containing protein